MSDNDPGEITESQLLDEVQVDFQDIIAETASIQGTMVGDLTRDLAAQRAVSKSLTKKLKTFAECVQAQQEIIEELRKQLKDLTDPPVEDLEHAERVLDAIIEEGATTPSNGDKPKEQEVASPRRPASPPVKETAKS